MTDNPWRKIYDAIGEAAALEMLAEEAAELSAAASKLARIVRGENPARINYVTAYSKMAEESADVCNAFDVLGTGLMEKYNVDFDHDVCDAMPDKMTRWYNSLFGEEEPK